jgi:O-antigen/teichoic acid export membrane protein
MVDRRYRRILEAGASALLSKGAALLVNLISLPIVVRYLGPVQFGIYASISTTLSLLLVLDLGIANALTNLISEAYAREDKHMARASFATAFWMMTTIATVLGFIGWVTWQFVSWDSIFHVDSLEGEIVARAAGVAYAVFLVGMPTGLVTKLLAGYQELRTANLFAGAGSIASLAGVILVTRLHGGLAPLVGASVGPLVAANAVCLLWVWRFHRPWLTPWPSSISREAGRRLLQTGSEFFLIQIAGLVVFNSDNLIIAHYAGPAEVTPYNVTWRLVGYASVLQTLMMPALWPAYAEAFVRGDYFWVRATFRRVMLATMGVALACCVVFMFAGRFLIRHWAGADAVPSETLVIWMCAWVLINTFMNNVACILVAASETRVQAWSSLASAVLNLVLSIWWVRSLGSVGVILGTFVSYLIALLVPQTWKTMQVLRQQANPTKVGAG